MISMDGDAASGRWRFGAVEVDEREARVRVDGKVVALDRSGFDLLVCLLRKADGIVSKDELLRAGWPGRVVTENSLTKAIGRLRQAINDPDGDCLRVVHGYGYRLVATPQRLPDEAEQAAATQAAVPSPSVALPQAAPLQASKPPAMHRTWLLAALGVVLALAAISTVRIGIRPAEPSAASAPQATAAPSASIAVLPFLDLSTTQDQGYFSDGLAEQLRDDLARLPQLRVPGRSASVAFRGAQADAKRVGKALNVGTVLEGSVRKSGERLRVTVQLIDTGNGYERWSQTYDRPLGELFALQDEIARAIVGALRIELLPDQRRELVRHATTSPEAYEQYLLAHNLFQDDETAHRRAIAAYERAVALDPGFVDAWIDLADLLGFSGLYADDAQEALAGKRRATEILDRVIALDPGRADAWLHRGIFRYAHWWNWQGAAADFERAATLGVSNPDHLMVEQARLLAAQGKLAEAIAVLQRAAQLQPMTSNAWTVMAYHYLGLGDYVHSHEAATQAVRRQPLDEHAHYYLGLGELLQGRAAAALPHFDDSAHVLRLNGQALAYHTLGDSAAAQRDLQLLITRYGHILPYNVAEVYAWRGDSDLAFQWLDRAVELHDASFMYLEFDPLLKNLHGDPRFAALLAKLGLPPLQAR